jgi:uncharacterized protein with NRDE domain
MKMQNAQYSMAVWRRLRAARYSLLNAHMLASEDKDQDCAIVISRALESVEQALELCDEPAPELPLPPMRSFRD